MEDVERWQHYDLITAKLCRLLRCRPDQMLERTLRLLDDIDRLRAQVQALEQNAASAPQTVDRKHDED